MAESDKLFERLGKEYPAGAVVFHEGDVGREMFVIQSGKVNITKRAGAGQTEKVLVSLGPGSFFGEMAVINQKPRSASAVVVEDAKLLQIDPKTFDAMIRGNVEIAVRMIKILAGRLQEADEQIENLLLKDHNSRVVHALSHMATKGRAMTGGTWVEATPALIADKVGLEANDVDGVLQKLYKARLIRDQEGGILIHDTNRLREYLEFLEMKEKFGDE